jgi:predicted amino acid dehydrogenase
MKKRRISAVTEFEATMHLDWREIMLLQNEVAVVYGAGGAVGSAVAKGFAWEGAKVFLTGRKPEQH